MIRVRRMPATRSAVLVRDSSARSAAKASVVNSPPADSGRRGVVRLEGSYNNRTNEVAIRDRSKLSDHGERFHSFKVTSTSCRHPISTTLLHERVKARREDDTR